MNQSNDTSTKNLENDWVVLTAVAEEFGWSEDEDNQKAWIEQK